MLHDESFRNFKFHDELHELSLEATSMSDIQKLDDLSWMTTSEIYNILSSSRQFLNDILLDEKLKQLRPMCDEFYEFECPQHIQEEAMRIKEIKLQEKMLGRKNAEDLNITKGEIDYIVNVMTEKITSPRIENERDYYDLANCLMLATGRRCVEVVKMMNLDPVNGNEYQAAFSGLAKTILNSNSGNRPILLPFRDILRSVNCLRSYKNFEDIPNRMVSASVKSGILSSTKRLFGRKLTHTQKRNLYVILGYERRHTSRFYPSCMRHHWSAFALGHSPKMTDTDLYMLMKTPDF